MEINEHEELLHNFLLIVSVFSSVLNCHLTFQLCTVYSFVGWVSLTFDPTHKTQQTLIVNSKIRGIHLIKPNYSLQQTPQYVPLAFIFILPSDSNLRYVPCGISASRLVGLT